MTGIFQAISLAAGIRQCRHSFSALGVCRWQRAQTRRCWLGSRPQVPQRGGAAGEPQNGHGGANGCGAPPPNPPGG